VGLRLLAATVAAAVAASPVSGSAVYLASRQVESGGIAEPGRQPDAQTTAWAALALAAAGGRPDELSRARAYLAAHESDARADTDVALQVLARSALGDVPAALVARLQAHVPGKLVNADVWTIVALRQAGQPAPPALVRAVRAAQRPSGGWSWTRGGAPDTNDTAAAIEALRASGISGAPIARGLAYLRARQNRDGGFALTPGRASDAQSTAWSIQAFLAAGAKAGAPAWRYLSRLRRPDGSYRYSAAYATTPVWVTAQVVPALAGKPFPLRSP